MFDSSATGGGGGGGEVADIHYPIACYLSFAFSSFYMTLQALRMLDKLKKGLSFSFHTMDCLALAFEEMRFLLISTESYLYPL
jgi:hypothetical protein